MYYGAVLINLQFPPDEHPSVSINQDILGTWHLFTHPFDSTEVRFEKKSDNEYNIIATLASVDDGGYHHSSFTGYFSYINGERLLNIKDTHNDNYYIVAYYLRKANFL